MPKVNGALIPGFISKQYREAKVFPDSQSMKGALLFIDVCKFTNLTQQVSQGGHYGVEIITQILNSYFGAVNAAINEQGGEIVKFAGDAILAYFPGDRTESNLCLNYAVKSIESKLSRLNRKFGRKFGIELAFHGMSAWGGFKSLIIGEQGRHLDFILSGTALRKLFAKEIPAGENTILHHGRVPQSPNCVEKANGRKARFSKAAENAFLPPSIRDTARYRTFTAELRNVAILFIHIDIGKFGKSTFSQDLNSAYVHIQQCVYRYEGLVNKIDFNEKGLVVLCSFGLPVAHLNDIERAVFAARAIVGYSRKGLFRIGITYSNIFCGILGAPKRYEYGVIGNGVNAAARLMMEAMPDQILVEELFVSKTRLRFELKYLKEVAVKGFPEPVRIYSIEQELAVNQHSLAQIYGARSQVAQKIELREVLELMSGPDEAATVFLGGEPGTGKTFFIWRLISRMQGKKIAFLALDEFNKAEQLFVLKQLWEQQTQSDLSDAEATELDAYCSLEGFSGEVLLRYFRETKDEVKSDGDRLLMQDAMFNSALLLLSTLCKELDLLIVDNLHWADHLSVRLLAEFHNCETHPHILLSSRHNIHADEFGLAQKIVLTNLVVAEARLLLAYELSNLAEEAFQHIYRVSGGNPLLMVELCTQVKEHLPDGNRLITLADLVALERVGFLPHTIENIYINRLNLLPEETQDLLKLAAIIGKAFSLDELKVLSRESIQAEVLKLLGSLDDQRVINIANITPEIIYIFSNNLMREAIYNTILLSEKRGLHKKIAEHYEQIESGQRGVELIANHYILADHADKAFDYSVMAAEKNFAAGSFEESSYYYQQALKHCAEPFKRAPLKLALVDSLFFHSEIERAKKLLEEIAHSALPGSLQNKYIYLQSKARYLVSAWGDLCEYLESKRGLMQRDEYYRLAMLFLADALRSMNRSAELQKLLTELEMDNQQDIYFMCKLESIRGQLAIDTSRYPQAQRHFRKALKLAGMIKDNMSIRIALQSLGNIARRKGDLQTAMNYLHKARQLTEKGGDRYGYMKVIMDIALIYRQEGDFSKAIEFYNKSLSMARVMGNKSLVQNISYNIGELFFQENKLEEARKHLSLALDLAQEIHDSWGISYAMDAMGDLCMAEGDLDKAEALYLQNISVQEQMGALEGKAHSLGNLGNVANARGQYHLALEFYLKNQQLCKEVGDLDGEGRAWYNSAIASWNLEELGEAKTKLKKAEKCFVDAGQQVFLVAVKDALQALEEEALKQL
jgi:class 3 adenylate cyclase/tetratricopeptide (TPR) repeat protein